MLIVTKSGDAFIIPEVDHIYLHTGDEVEIAFTDVGGRILPYTLVAEQTGEAISVHMHTPNRCEYGRCAKPILFKRQAHSTDPTESALADLIDKIFGEPGKGEYNG